MTQLFSHRVVAKEFPKQKGWKVPRKVTEPRSEPISGLKSQRKPGPAV